MHVESNVIPISLGRLTVIRDLPLRGRAMAPIEAAPRRPRRTLADDPDFRAAAACVRDSPIYECDLESGAWPELVDQSTLDMYMADPFRHEDDEADDRDTGIEDEGHDALEEDGI